MEESKDSLTTVRIVATKKTFCSAESTTIYTACTRNVHRDHVRLVWKGFTESRQGSDTGEILIQLVHTGWTKVSRAQADDGSSAAHVQSYSRIHPPLASSAIESDASRNQRPLHQWRRVGPFTDSLISSYQEHALSARQLIENELMDNRHFRVQASSAVC